MPDEVLSVLFLEILARCGGVDGETLLDRSLRIVVGAVGTLALREVEGNVREHLNRRVEQSGPLDAIRSERSDLEDEPPAVRVADPLRGVNARIVECFEQVVNVGRDRPGWFPL